MSGQRGGRKAHRRNRQRRNLAALFWSIEMVWQASCLRSVVVARAAVSATISAAVTSFAQATASITTRTVVATRGFCVIEHYDARYVAESVLVVLNNESQGDQKRSAGSLQ